MPYGQPTSKVSSRHETGCSATRLRCRMALVGTCSRARGCARRARSFRDLYLSGCSRSTVSVRPFPRTLPEVEYPGHFETRYVSENGGIRWKKCWVNVTTTLAREWVGLEEVGDGLWDVYFSRLRLGRLDQRRMRIEDPYGRWTRWEVLTMSPDKSVTDVSD